MVVRKGPKSSILNHHLMYPRQRSQGPRREVERGLPRTSGSRSTEHERYALGMLSQAMIFLAVLTEI